MYGRSSLVVNNPTCIKTGNHCLNDSAKIVDVQPFYYRYRKCDSNLNSNTPANQYQRLKLIQNTVRVYSSLYTMNLAGLNAYEVPNVNYELVDIGGSNYLVSPGVNWNQMSDRRQPHKQFANASGSTYGGNSLKRSLTRLRPGALSPGGNGVDIKHNSYDRYLNRLKGRAPLRRGIIPPNFGQPISFNRAFPIYGGKTTKTSIVNNCNCPIITDNTNNNLLVEEKVLEKSIYNNGGDIENELNNVEYIFHVGGKVYVEREGSIVVAQILEIFKDGTYLIEFLDNSTAIKFKAELFIYLPCDNCNLISGKNNLDYKSFTDSNLTIDTCLDAAYLALKNQL
jgi:hypothetical protein